MKRFLIMAVVFLLGAWMGAQSTTSQIGSVVAATHASCTVTTSTTQICFANDGLWLSVSGAAYVQVQTGTAVTGVTSITVNGGIAQTGPVALTIPTKAISTTTSSTTTAIQ